MGAFRGLCFTCSVTHFRFDAEPYKGSVDITVNQ